MTINLFILIPSLRCFHDGEIGQFENSQYRLRKQIGDHIDYCWHINRLKVRSINLHAAMYLAFLSFITRVGSGSQKTGFISSFNIISVAFLDAIEIDVSCIDC